MSCKGKVVISFDVEGVCQIEQSSEETSLSASADRALILFHELCEKTFDEACKAHYGGQQIQRAHIDEFDEDLPGNRFEKLDDNLSSSNAHASPSMTRGRALLAASPRQPDGRRQELIWKSATGVRVTLDDISLQFQDFLYSHPPSSEPILNRRRGRYMARTSHRCPGYNRIEITLTPDISRSAIVSHSSPTPGEICPVCKEVVREAEVFNCTCGNYDNESMPTVQCSTCSEWHHRPCVGFFDAEKHKFVCGRCQSPRYPINYGDNQEIDSNDRLREDIATKAMEGRMREEVPEAVSCGPAASSESLQPNVVTEPPVSKAGGGSTIPSVPTELTLTGQHDAEGSLKPVVRDVVVVDSVSQETCLICIENFEGGDIIRLLPCEGKHFFHQQCVDPWLLEYSSSCPICRQDISALANMISGRSEDPHNNMGNPRGGGQSAPGDRFPRYLRWWRRPRSHRPHREGRLLERMGRWLWLMLTTTFNFQAAPRGQVAPRGRAAPLGRAAPMGRAAPRDRAAPRGRVEPRSRVSRRGQEKGEGRPR